MHRKITLRSNYFLRKSRKCKHFRWTPGDGCPYNIEEGYAAIQQFSGVRDEGISCIFYLASLIFVRWRDGKPVPYYSPFTLHSSSLSHISYLISPISYLCAMVRGVEGAAPYGFISFHSSSLSCISHLRMLAAGASPRPTLHSSSLSCISYLRRLAVGASSRPMKNILYPVSCIF